MRSLRNKRFYNTHVKSTLRSPLHFFLWLVGYYREKNNPPPLPTDFVYPNPICDHEAQASVTWINHATFLVEVAGLTFLTDPIFSKRCSPMFFCGPKRQHLPLPDLPLLPKIDFILISHNHYDHLDLQAIKFLIHHYPDLKLVVPENLKQWFLKKKIRASSVIELSWYQEFRENNLSIVSVPAQHFSGRGLFDKNATHWMGIVVEVFGKRFYFVGDTGYNDQEFREVKENLGDMDLTLIPIGTYNPRKFMQNVHINPEEAVKIHLDVNSRLSVAGHWNTFRLSEEELYRPPYDLFLALKKIRVPVEQFRVLHPGQKIYW